MKTLKKLLCTALAVMMIMSTMAVVTVSAATVKAPKVTLSNTSKGVKISWKKAGGAKKYVISRKLSTAKKASVIKTVKSAKAGSFTDKKAKTGKKYQYTVTAYRGSASAAASKTIVRLKAPTGVKVQANLKDYNIKITWNKSTGAKKYEVYRAKVNGSKTGSYKKIDTVSSNKYSDTSVSSGASYKYKIKAVNGSSKSDYSSASKKVDYVESVQFLARMSEDYKAVCLYLPNATDYKNYKIYRSVGNSKTYKKIAQVNPATAEKGVPVDVEYSDYYKTLMVALGISEKEINEQMMMPKYTDKDVVLGETYNYYIEVEADGTGFGTFFKSGVVSIKFDDADLTMKVGETDSSILNLDSYLGDAANEMEETGVSIDTTFTSDNLNVVTIDEKGVITAVAPGVATVSVEVKIKAKIGFTKQTVATVTTKFRVRVTE
ncbi:MAG: fibronectin type III domain-containing protein [Ruminococcus sp.]